MRYSIFFTLLSLGLLTACQGGLQQNMQRTLKTVDQGLYGLANTVSQTDAITGKRTLNLANRKQQIAQGNQQVAKVIKQYREARKPINEQISSQEYARLQRIFKAVHSVSHYRDEKWSVIMLPDSSFNAWTTGGTAIVVNYGTMKQSTDAELAAIIGHEIAHVTSGHVFERSGLKTLGSLAGSKAIKTKEFSTAYTHEMEEEADEIGILYAALAGYDPYAAPKLWLNDYKQDGTYGRYMSNHPISTERYQNTKRVADKVQSYYVPGRVNPAYKAVLNNNTLFQKQQSSGNQSGFAAATQLLMGALAEKNKTKQEINRQKERIAIIRTLEKGFSPKSLKVVSSKTIEGIFTYQGDYEIKNPTFAVINDKNRYVGRYQGTVRNGSTFKVRFPMTKKLTSTNVKWQLDFVEAVRKIR